MEPAGALDLVEFAANSRHAVADQPPVGLDLGFAGAAEEAEAAALAFKVGPAAHQPPRLIIEMRQLDLQAPFRGRRALAENLEDQPGAVDHLGLGALFQRLLLDRGQPGIDDQQARLILAGDFGDFLDLALAEQARRPDVAQLERAPCNHIDPDRLGKSLGLVQPRFGRAKPAAAGAVGNAPATRARRGQSRCRPRG